MALRQAVVISLILALMVTDAVGQGHEEHANRVLNNVSHEFTECAGYYFVAAGGLRNSGEDEAASQYDEAAYQALMYARVTGESPGISEQAMLARLEMAMDGMMEAIDQNYANISILLRDYSELCLGMMNEPDRYLAERFLQEGISP